eukprot:scaffold180_cov311-Pinguiococcus_pyrenoidosus.AAC.31
MKLPRELNVVSPSTRIGPAARRTCVSLRAVCIAPASKDMQDSAFHGSPIVGGPVMADPHDGVDRIACSCFDQCWLRKTSGCRNVVPTTGSRFSRAGVEVRQVHPLEPRWIRILLQRGVIGCSMSQVGVESDPFASFVEQCGRGCLDLLHFNFTLRAFAPLFGSRLVSSPRPLYGRCMPFNRSCRLYITGWNTSARAESEMLRPKWAGSKKHAHWLGRIAPSKVARRRSVPRIRPPHAQHARQSGCLHPSCAKDAKRTREPLRSPARAPPAGSNDLWLRSPAPAPWRRTPGSSATRTSRCQWPPCSTTGRSATP